MTSVAGDEAQRGREYDAQAAAQQGPLGRLAPDRAEVKAVGEAPLRRRAHQALGEVQREAVQFPLAVSVASG